LKKEQKSFAFLNELKNIEDGILDFFKKKQTKQGLAEGFLK